MSQLTLEQQITHLQIAINHLRILRNEGVDLTATIEQAESKLNELCKQAGWHCVSLIWNGSVIENCICGIAQPMPRVCLHLAQSTPRRQRHFHYFTTINTQQS